MDLEKMTIAELVDLKRREVSRLFAEETADYDRADAPFWVRDMVKPVSFEPRIMAIQAAIDRKR